MAEDGERWRRFGPSTPVSPPAIAITVVETGVDPVTPRFSGVCSAD
jgi:hypothetical protein